MNKLPPAEKMNYWKSSSRSVDAIFLETEKLIINLGGLVTLKAESKHNGRAAFLLCFSIGEDHFEILWPVLPCSNDTEQNLNAARRQAATMIFHDVKNRLLRAKVFGTKNAFLQFLVLENGQTASEMSATDLPKHLPKFLMQ